MIINSLLDTDLYKISVNRIFMRYFANLNARYEFKCRNDDIIFTKKMFDEIEKEIDHLCTLRFTESELKYIGDIYYMRDAKWFIEFLRMFQLNRNYIKCELKNDKLIIVAEGPIWQAMMFEIYVLAIVNEVYFYFQYPNSKRKFYDEGIEILKRGLNFVYDSKIPFAFADFGTRRRYSFEWQELLIQYLKQNAASIRNFVFNGTSNVLLAKQNNLKPIGTFGHEFVMACQGLDDIPVAKSQLRALQIWQEEYNGALGIALSDTLGSAKFFRDFNLTYCKLFDGVRHDSGDPFRFGENVIKHYQKMGIDPITKTIVFSDGLNFGKAVSLNEFFNGRIKTSYGIGTSFTNNFGNVDNHKPLNIVMKMTECNGKPVAKISDDIGKGLCNDQSYLSYLEYACNVI